MRKHHRSRLYSAPGCSARCSPYRCAPAADSDTNAHRAILAPRMCTSARARRHSAGNVVPHVPCCGLRADGMGSACVPCCALHDCMSLTHSPALGRKSSSCTARPSCKHSHDSLRVSTSPKHFGGELDSSLVRQVHRHWPSTRADTQWGPALRASGCRSAHLQGPALAFKFTR